MHPTTVAIIECPECDATFSFVADSLAYVNIVSVQIMLRYFLKHLIDMHPDGLMSVHLARWMRGVAPGYPLAVN